MSQVKYRRWPIIQQVEQWHVLFFLQNLTDIHDHDNIRQYSVYKKNSNNMGGVLSWLKSTLSNKIYIHCFIPCF